MMRQTPLVFIIRMPRKMTNAVGIILDLILIGALCIEGTVFSKVNYVWAENRTQQKQNNLQMMAVSNM